MATGLQCHIRNKTQKVLFKKFVMFLYKFNVSQDLSFYHPHDIAFDFNRVFCTCRSPINPSRFKIGIGADWDTSWGSTISRVTHDKMGNVIAMNARTGQELWGKP
jgi:hypothetical protein